MSRKPFANDFYFVANDLGDPECQLCNRTVARWHIFNMQRHFKSCHQDKADKNVKILDISKKRKKDPINDSMINECHEKASFMVSLALAKHCRPFDDGVFIKTVMQNVLQCYGNEGEKMANLINDAPFSRRTIARRTEKISRYIFSKTLERLMSCKYYSLSLDESVDVNNICQLIICVKSVNEQLETFEEIFDVVALHGNVTGQVIYNIVVDKVFSVADKQKLSAICTDGARVMVGKRDGFVGQLLQNGINVPTFHCIIHQQALFAKEVSMKDTMDTSIKIINKIRGG